MSADALSATSRGFYERSKAKVTISLVLGAASMMLLGFCANAGGQVRELAINILGRFMKKLSEDAAMNILLVNVHLDQWMCFIYRSC